RDHRHGKNIRGKDGEDDAERKVNEQILADSVKKCDWEKYDGGGEGSGQHRHVHFVAAAFGGDFRSLAALEPSKDIFEHDDGVIYESREDQGQPTQEHGVDGAAHQVVNDHADEHGERNCQQNNEGRASAAEKDQNHDAGKHNAYGRFLHQIFNRDFDENGLIENHRRLQRCRDIDQALYRFANAADDGNGVAVSALLE